MAAGSRGIDFMTGAPTSAMARGVVAGDGSMAPTGAPTSAPTSAPSVMGGGEEEGDGGSLREVSAASRRVVGVGAGVAAVAVAAAAVLAP